MTAELILVNLAIALASAVQATAGLGFVMVAAPLIGLVNLAYLPGSILLANIFLSFSMLLRDGRSLARAEITPLCAGLIAGTILGALMLTQVPSERLGVLFGAIILGAVALSVLAPQVPLTTCNVLLGATAGGFTGIVAGMHAPPLVMLYQREKPEKIRATFAVLFVFGCLLALTGLHLAGRFGTEEAVMGLSLLPGVAIGYMIGRLLAGRVSQSAARTTMLTISAIGGVMLLVKSL